MTTTGITRRGALASMTSAIALTFSGGVVMSTVAKASETSEASTKSGASAPADQMQTLTSLAHVMFPHKQLPMSFYHSKALAYLSEVERSSKALAQLNEGLRFLDGSYIAPFSKLPEVIQDSMVEKIDQKPFFKAYLWRLSELVYRDPVVWKMVGYEGSSVEKGGYLHRGFDDIDWLPVSSEKATGGAA